MSLRAVPAGFDPVVVGGIDARLDMVEHDHDARILLAVESGSRAWGFGSPDSDYDVRFVYLRSTDQYLSPWSKRDVIETPLDATYDVNGWDLGKALKLLLKGNAVVVEWLTSPIIYRGDATFRDAISQFAARYGSRAGLIRHYRHLGERQYRTYCGPEEVELKKLFYALRPAMALRWLRAFSSCPLPPMHFPTLVAESAIPVEVADFTARMLALKAVSHELGTAILPAAIRQFIIAEFEAAAHGPEITEEVWGTDAVPAADALFQHALGWRNPAAPR